MSRKYPVKNRSYPIQAAPPVPQIPPQIETYPPIQRSSTILRWSYRRFEQKYDKRQHVRSSFGYLFYALGILIPLCLLVPFVLYLLMGVVTIASAVVSILLQVLYSVFLVGVLLACAYIAILIMKR
jgi:hypothetical protein